MEKIQSIRKKRGIGMKYKVIVNPSFARQLIHKGHHIIDIKPRRENPKETVFIFENTEILAKDLVKIVK